MPARVRCQPGAVVELSENRKDMARKIGADAVIDPREEDVVEVVQRLTDGMGVDALFDATGVQETLQTAFHMTARGGRVVNVAIWEQSIELDPNDMVLSKPTPPPKRNRGPDKSARRGLGTQWDWGQLHLYGGVDTPRIAPVLEDE